MKIKQFITVLPDYTPAMISGFLLTLSFPKADLPWLAWFALVPLILSLYKLNEKQAFKAGFVMGLSHFLSLIYWIVPTISIYGQLPLFLALPVLLLLSAYLALYPALFALGIRCLHSNLANKSLSKGSFPDVLMPLTAAALWVATEYIRSNFLTGFPWGVAGYTQYMHLNLIQIADITSVYGISFVIVLTNGVLALVFRASIFSNSGSFQKKSFEPELKYKNLESGQTTKRAVIIWLCSISVMFGSLFAYGKMRISEIKEISASSESVNVSVIQGNIEQILKWNEAYQESTIKKYCELSMQTTQQQPDLIIWPETALPFYYSWNKKMSSRVDSCIRDAKTSFLIGSPAFTTVDEKAKIYHIFNRAYMINKLALITGSYDKIHLVPFGEYVPFGKYLTFLGKIIAQAGDFSSGEPDQKPLAFNNGSSAGVMICFEIIFPYLSRRAVQNGAQILVTMTNDAWFGYTSAPKQHFTMSIFRAIENRRGVARAANTGISGFIAPTGEIIEISKLFEESAITRPMPSLKIQTVYTAVGDLFAYICLFAISVACVINIVNRR